MSRFPHYLRQKLAARDKANVDHATQGNENPEQEQTYFPGHDPGDAHKLRGIPAVGRNVRGAIPGTTPGDQR